MCFNPSFSGISDQGNANHLPQVTKFFHKAHFFLSKMYNLYPSKFNKQAMFSTIFLIENLPEMLLRSD